MSPSPAENEPNPFQSAPENFARPNFDAGNPVGYENPSDRPPEAKTGRCLLFGCIGVFVTGLLLILCAGFGTYFAVQKQVEKYTATEPADLPTVEYSDEDIETLQARLDSFQTTLNPEPEPESDATSSEANGQAESEVAAEPESEPESVSELVLSADDINALIATSPDLKGRVFVAIDDGKITGEISVPIDSFVPGSKGRYLNGSGTFDVSLDEGILVVSIDAAEVKGEPIPESIMQGLRQQNLAKDLYKDKDTADMIRRFKSIRIEDDKIIAELKEQD